MSRIRSIHPGLWTDVSRRAGLLSHLYVIQEEDGACKIGIARNAMWRRGDLQTGNHRRLHVRAIYEAERADAVVAEAAVLNHFRQYRISGEWLDVTPDVLIGYIEEEFADGAD